MQHLCFEDSHLRERGKSGALQKTKIIIMLWLLLYSLSHRIHFFFFFFTIWIQTHNLQVRKQVISIVPEFWCLKNSFMVKKYTDTTLILLPSHTGLMLIFKWAPTYILIEQKFQVAQIILGKRKKIYQCLKFVPFIISML